METTESRMIKRCIPTFKLCFTILPVSLDYYSLFRFLKICINRFCSFLFHSSENDALFLRKENNTDTQKEKQQQRQRLHKNSCHTVNAPAAMNTNQTTRKTMRSIQQSIILPHRRRSPPHNNNNDCTTVPLPC